MATVATMPDGGAKLTPFKQTPGVSASLRQISADAFYVVNEVVIKRLGPIPILKVRNCKGHFGGIFGNWGNRKFKR